MTGTQKVWAEISFTATVVCMVKRMKIEEWEEEGDLHHY